jgi:hypothetical protein
MALPVRDVFAIVALLLNLAPTAGFVGHAKISLRNHAGRHLYEIAASNADEQRSDYIARQREAFDESAVFFASEAAVPPEVMSFVVA